MKFRGVFREYQLIFNLAQKWLDLVIIFSGLLLLTHFVGMEDWSESRNISLGIAACALFSFFSKQNGLYQSWRTKGLLIEFSLLCYTQAGVVLGLLFLGYVTKSTGDFSRLVVGIWIIQTPLILLSVRILVRNFLRELRKNGYNSKRIAVLGHGHLAQQLVKEISSNEHMGMEICGYFDNRKVMRDHVDGTPKHSILGAFDDAIAAAKRREFDELYIALPMNAEHKISHLIKELSDCSINVHMVPDIFTFNLINSKTSSVGSLPTVSIYESPLDEYGTLIKRTEDFILSLVILLLISIPMFCIALGIKLTSKGPVLFKQRRYGMGGEEIWVWKFRSMTVAEDGELVTQAKKNDSRVTAFGNFLRKTSLDELPQFINVLQGQMSIVGPRPHAVVHNELYRKVIDSYMLRHLVKPGITGWAQINGWRGETDSDEKMLKRIQYDLDYIKHWSLRLDLKIIILTIFKGFVGKNAY